MNILIFISILLLPSCIIGQDTMKDSLYVTSVKNSPNIFFERKGKGKQKLILLHGFGATRKSYYDILPFLEEKFDIYLLDLVGFGDSYVQPDWDFKPESQAREIYKFLKDNKISNSILVGHSYGGSIVLLILSHLEKEKDYSTINKAILIDPAAYLQELPFFVQIPRTPIINFIFFSLVPDEYQAKYTLKYLFFDDNKVTNERINRYASYYRKKTHKKTIIKSAKNMLPNNIDDIQERIKKISFPTLIIWGEYDPVISKENIQRLKRELKNSVLKVIEKSGHIPHEESPEETADVIIEFLKD